MKPPILKDLKRWQKLNKNIQFSLYDYLFHINKTNKLNSDIYFAFQELFWPTFVVYKNYVILKEHFSEEKVEQLLKDNKNVEYWMNLLIIDSFFEGADNANENAQCLSETLVKIWEIKLKKDFPHLSFTVKYQQDQENGDYGLTFYQDPGHKKPYESLA